MDWMMFFTKSSMYLPWEIQITNFFQEKNKFVYSVWMSRITAGLALSILCDFEDEKDGRGVYFKLMDIYECASSMKQQALMAMTRMSALSLSYNTTGGV